MEQNCAEQMLYDVVRVQLIPSERCDIIVPFQIPVTETPEEKVVNGETVSRLGTSELSIATNTQESDNGMMEDSPRLTQTTKTTMVGPIVSHTLEVPVIGGFESTATAAKRLNRKDFHVVMTTESGARYLLYALPNSCECLMNGQGVRQNSTLTITLQSASHVIRLT